MANKLKIKVCGMLDPNNREAVSKAGADMLGFIFYSQSKRYVGNLPADTLLQLLGTNAIKTGVFVDEEIKTILEVSAKYQLDFIQLHGSESPSDCQKIKNQRLGIIKAFGVDEDFNFEKLSDYFGVVDYFLFDTKTDLHGGSGKKFNWEKLNEYSGQVPFFLSGGIAPEDIEIIKSIKHRQMAGIDLNSGFEDKPGLKNIEELKKFIYELK